MTPTGRQLSEVAQLTCDLIRLDTTNPPGHELAACLVIRSYLEAQGVSAEVREFAPGRANLVARIPGADGPAFAFSGHLDVVPANAAQWSSPPFEPVVRGGSLYGRGSVDMKGAIAAMTVAFARLAQRAEHLDGDVLLLLTAGEEVDSAGARVLVDSGELDDVQWIVIGEPTRLDVGIGHKGGLWIDVSATGKAAHSSQPEMGHNAVDELMRWVVGPPHVSSLVQYPAHEQLGAPSLSLNRISGGRAINIVPDGCEAVIDVRTLPGQSHQALLKVLRDRSGDVAVDPRRSAPAVAAQVDGALVAAAREAVSNCRPAETVALRGLPYVTDGSVFCEAGDMDIILLGPGDERLAHQADEHVDLAELDHAADSYEQVVDRLLVRQEVSGRS